MKSQGNFDGLHAELTDKILHTFFAVSNELGFGFAESVYRRSMVIALQEAGLEVEEERAIPVIFRGRSVGVFYADLVVNATVILELKASNELSRTFEAQLLHYLRSTRIEVGLVLAFGDHPRFRRVVFSNDRKRDASPRPKQP